MPPRREAPTSPRPVRLSRSDSAQITIPSRSWKAVQSRVDEKWVPQFAPHHSILGQNGSGKTHLIVYGLLPLCTKDNVCIFDSKGDDPVLWHQVLVVSVKFRLSGSGR